MTRSEFRDGPMQSPHFEPFHLTDDPLNNRLDAENLEICVPWGCWLDRPSEVKAEEWTTLNWWQQWGEYAKSLGKATSQPCLEQPCTYEFCWTGCYWPGWTLRGDCAIEHARRVHERLMRQFLRYSEVSAVDVGFAVVEGTRRFENVLAIRVHVTRKRSPHSLNRAGYPSFTSLKYLRPQIEDMKDDIEERLTQWTNGETEVFGQELTTWSNRKQEKFRADLESGLAEGPVAKEKLAKWQKSLPKDGHFERYPISGVRPCDLSSHWSPTVPHPGYEWCRLSICGVPIDIVEAEYFPSILNGSQNTPSGVFVDAPQTSRELSLEELKRIRRNRVNPLAGGISVGTVTGQAGTLGAVVWDRTDGAPCLLSNWHVLAGNPAAQVGQPCFQPALFDGGSEADKVGFLKRWLIGEQGDAALAELSGERNYASGEILGLWDPIAGYEKPRLNMEVRKLGRTTGFSEGFVDGLYLATNIDYGFGNIRYFKNQFHIAPLYPGQDFSQVGDSGSLVVTRYKPGRLSLHQLELLKLLRQAVSNSHLSEKIKEILGNPRLSRNQQITELLTLLEEPELNQADETNQEGIVDSCFPETTEQLTEFLGKFIRNFIPQLTEKDLSTLMAAPLDQRLHDLGLDVDEIRDRKTSRMQRQEQRVYFAVGMLFAGDTPGSPFGEFALATDVGELAQELDFSLCPVYEPRTSFRKLRGEPRSEGRARPRDPRILEPGGLGTDPRGRSPQPDTEPFQSGPDGP
ncbi:MAG: hypothetical protein K0U98_25180 [Deltaproteobacteria bacterium]|nr:hypothetical protein [Deltaproteobacteria bacterium]